MNLSWIIVFLFCPFNTAIFTSRMLEAIHNSARTNNVAIITSDHLKTDELLSAITALSKNHGTSLVSVNQQEVGKTMKNCSVVLLSDTDNFVSTVKRFQHSDFTLNVWFILSFSGLNKLITDNKLFGVDSRVFILDVNEEVLHVSEIYSLENLRIENDLGFIDPSTKDSEVMPKFDINVFKTRRRDFKGIRLKAIVETNPTFYSFRNTDRTTYIGILPDVFRVISDRLNFTFELIQCRPRYIWGVELSNGTWIGLIGQLMSHEGHIGIPGSAMDDARSRVVDFSPHIVTWDSGLLIRTSYGGLSFSHAYLSEFSDPSWLFIGVGYLVLGAPILVILYVYTSDLRRSLLRTALILYNSLLFKGSNDSDLRKLSSRILFMTLLLTTMLIHIHYRSTMNAVLTVKKDLVQFTTYEEILGSDFDVYCLKGTVSCTYFRDAPEGDVRRQLWDKKIKGENVLAIRSIPELLNIVMEGKSIVKTNLDRLYASGLFPCQMRDIPELRNRNYYHYLYPKNSPYKEFIDQAILDMHEQGIIQRIRDSYRLRLEDQCPEEKSLDLMSTGIPFVVLVLGIGISALSIIFELFSGWTRPLQDDYPPKSESEREKLKLLADVKHSAPRLSISALKDIKEVIEHYESGKEIWNRGFSIQLKKQET